MQSWMKKVDSQVSGNYVKPLYPKKGEDVTLSIKVPNEVIKVRLFIRFNGCYDNNECNLKDGKAYCTVNMKSEDEVKYYFAVKTEETYYYYYSVLGLTQSLPCERDMFVIKAGIKNAAWVSESTCYQIFPDRFRDGDKSLDLKTGEYSFDGGIVKKMEFDQAPLEFEDGRCLDFFGGDLQGIIDSVDYFKRLNVSCLYLNPIGVSRTTHRYDCCDFFHVDEKLGGDEKFIELVDVMHKNGIKVVIDISINHTGTDHPWFIKASEDNKSKEASYYYISEDGSVACWENVPTLPQLNYTNEELRGLIYKNKDSVLRKFINPPFNQDGWRLDVADVVGRRGKDQLCEEIWREVNTVVKKDKSDAYLVGECWNDANEYLKGDMWDACMNYVGCGRPIRRWMGERDRYLLDGWGENPGKTKPYTGTALKDHLSSQLNTLLGQMRYLQMNLFDSHDTPRLHTNYEVYDENIFQGCVMLSYLLPGMPSTYYGDEVGLKGNMETVEAWRYPMQWDESKWNKYIFDSYCALGKLRKDEINVLSEGAFTFLTCDEKRMTFARYNDDKAIILVLNRGEEADFKIDLGALEGKKLSVLLGDGTAILKDDSISCRLKDKKSIILSLE